MPLGDVVIPVLLAKIGVLLEAAATGNRPNLDEWFFWQKQRKSPTIDSAEDDLEHRRAIMSIHTGSVH